MHRQIISHLRGRDWVVIDLVLSAAAMLLAYVLQPQFALTWHTPIPTQPGPFLAALVYASVMVLCMHVGGLHDPLGDRSGWWAILRTALGVIAALGFSMIIFYFISLQQIGRSILLRTFFFSVTLQASARIVFCPDPRILRPRLPLRRRGGVVRPRWRHLTANNPHGHFNIRMPYAPTPLP